MGRQTRRQKTATCPACLRYPEITAGSAAAEQALDKGRNLPEMIPYLSASGSLNDSLRLRTASAVRFAPRRQAVRTCGDSLFRNRSVIQASDAPPYIPRRAQYAAGKFPPSAPRHARGSRPLWKTRLFCGKLFKIVTAFPAEPCRVPAFPAFFRRIRPQKLCFRSRILYIFAPLCNISCIFFPRSACPFGRGARVF